MGRKLTHHEFIKKLMIQNINIYEELDFLEEFKNTTTKILASSRHGNIKVLPKDVLSGRTFDIRAAVDKTSFFVSESNEIHKNKYTYSGVKYKSARSKINVSCEKHGLFSITPNDHLSGKGCPKCAGKYSKKYNKNGIPLYETFSSRLIAVGVECKRNIMDDNILDVKCHKCGIFFTPSLRSVENKIRAGFGMSYGEHNLYCSDSCKHLCPTFNFKSCSIDPESLLYIESEDQDFARKCQTNHLKQIQCDEFNYNYCERCGDIVDVELHHTLEISKYGKKSVNSSGHILLCAGCHVSMHSWCK